MSSIGTPSPSSRTSQSKRHALSVAEILAAILAYLDNEQLQRCRAVSRSWAATTRTVRHLRSQQNLHCTMPGFPDEVHTFVGWDLLDGRVMKYRPLSSAALLREARNLVVTVNGVPAPIVQCFDRYIICQNFALEVAQGSDDSTVDVIAVYKPLSAQGLGNPMLERLWKNASWRTHQAAFGAMRLYLTTSKIGPLMEALLDDINKTFHTTFDAIANERNRLEILRIMKHEQKASTVLNSMLAKLDREFVAMMFMLNIVVSDFAYASRDELRDRITRSFFSTFASVYTPSRCKRRRLV